MNASKEINLEEKNEVCGISIEEIEQSMQPFWVGQLDFPNVPWQELTEQTVWENHINLLGTIYGLNDNITIIPKGTILFHASDIRDPVGNIPKSEIKPNKPFFFGLDAFIAIWYASETYNRSAYLNVYKLQEDLENVYYIGNNIMDLNPGEIEKCKQEQPCLHPQFGYHSNDQVLEPPVELSLELTLPSQNLEKYKLKYLLAYDIDIHMLQEKKDTTFTSFKATKALRNMIIDCSVRDNDLFT